MSSPKESLFEEKKDIIFEVLSDTHFELEKLNDSQKTIKRIEKKLRAYVDTKPIVYKKAMSGNNIKDGSIISKPFYKCLCLAGDICNIKQLPYVLEAMSDDYDHIFYVPGNHEYYGEEMDELDDKLEYLNQFYGNVTIFTKKCQRVFIYEDLVFHGSTLWFKCQNHGCREHWRLNDFRKIQKSGQDITLDDIETMFEENVKEIEKTIELNIDTVVMTHHLPSLECGSHIHPNNHCGFATSIDHVIKPPIATWIYGHSHTNLLTHVNDVFLCSNQIGYGNENNSICTNKIAVMLCF